eukprot:6203364-Pleurochrysis_carterae.AAC.7
MSNQPLDFMRLNSFLKRGNAVWEGDEVGEEYSLERQVTSKRTPCTKQLSMRASSNLGRAEATSQAHLRPPGQNRLGPDERLRAHATVRLVAHGG